MAVFSRRSASPTPLDGVDVVLADLDGVVYAGAGALPWAVEQSSALGERRLGFITNNAARTDEAVVGSPAESALRRRHRTWSPVRKRQPACCEPA